MATGSRRGLSSDGTIRLLHQADSTGHRRVVQSALVPGLMVPSLTPAVLSPFSTHQLANVGHGHRPFASGMSVMPVRFDRR